MKLHQINCPKCKGKGTVTWTQKLTKTGVEIFIHRCTKCQEISDVINAPELKEQKEQEYYLE